MNECSGAATVRLEMPVDMQSALIFHYNLKFYNKDTDNFEGTSLKRFVMQVTHFLDSFIYKQILDTLNYDFSWSKFSIV